MDTPLLSTIFRQLFRHSAGCQKRTIPASTALIAKTRDPTSSRSGNYGYPAERKGGQNRQLHSRARGTLGKREWQPRSSKASQDMSEEFKRYPLVTADMLSRKRERPKRVKMLVRDFIDSWHTLHGSHTAHRHLGIIIC